MKWVHCISMLSVAPLVQAAIVPPPSAAGYGICVDLFQAQQCTSDMYQEPTGYWFDMPRTPLCLIFPLQGGNEYTAPHPHNTADNKWPDIKVSYSPNAESGEAYVKVENPAFCALLVLKFTKPGAGSAQVYLHEDGQTHHMRHVTFNMEKAHAYLAPVTLPTIDDCEGDPQMLDDGMCDIIAGLEALDCKSAGDILYRKRLLTLLPLIQMSGDANMTLPETKGNTALHYACSLGHEALVEWLVNHGANTEAVTDKGATVDACVGGKNAKNIRHILQQARANPPKETPEQAAASAGKWLEQAFGCKDMTSKLAFPVAKVRRAAETLFRYVDSHKKHPFGVHELSRMGRMLTWAQQAELTEKEFVDTVLSELREAQIYWKNQKSHSFINHGH